MTSNPLSPTLAVYRDHGHLAARLRFARYRSDLGLDNGGDLDDFRVIVS